MANTSYLVAALRGIRKALDKLRSLRPGLRDAWWHGQMHYFREQESRLVSTLNELSQLDNTHDIPGPPKRSARGKTGGGRGHK